MMDLSSMLDRFTYRYLVGTIMQEKAGKGKALSLRVSGNTN